MGPHFLRHILCAGSIAVIGATGRKDAVGGVVLRNLIRAKYRGELYAVNPKHRKVQGRRCWPDIESIGRPIELAVIATPARTVPDIIEQCGAQGVRGAVVLSAGFAEAGPEGRRLQEAMLEAARRHDLRIIGPNCLGIIRPELGLNATFSRNSAQPGDLALVSQSGAICTAVLDWAESQQIGFSTIASLGGTADVDLGDVLDFLALDRNTRSILLYVEGVTHARGFMSGLRAAARMKPVIVIKSGRHESGSRAAMSHTGAIVGADDVFDAALERAGAVRVPSVEQLFSAARMLAGGHRVRGNRLAVVGNAGGPGVMAADRAADLDVAMAELGDATMTALDAFLPAHWSHGNPVDILGDADPERYRRTLEAVLADRDVDGTLVMLTPQAMTDPMRVAEVVTETKKKPDKPVIACWMGDCHVRAARDHFTQHHLPHFSTPEASVEAFSHLAAHHRNQQLLLQVPGPLVDRARTDVDSARLIIEGALAARRNVLSTMEAKAVLSAFRIPITQTVQVHTANEAMSAAGTIGYPVAMKIDSPDIIHKTEASGVRLDIGDAADVRIAFQEMMEAAKRHDPKARIDGVTVERMHRSVYGRELMIGAVRDPVFGPVVSFGSGGTSVEVLRDRAVALPPLNELIIRGMVARTRVARLLDRFRNMPAVDAERLEQVLIRISELVCELPEVVELDINPLIADERGLVAVDARIGVSERPSAPEPYGHMAIHPYPAHLVREWQLADGTTLIVRPIRPEDAEIEQAFVRRLSARSRYFRFMHALHELTPQMLVRYTQIDYDREMALIAVKEEDDGGETQVAVARYTANPDRRSCEFALVVADEWQGHGIGTYLMRCLMEIAESRRLRTIEGEVLAENTPMLALMKHLGFTIRSSPEGEEIKAVSKRLY